MLFNLVVLIFAVGVCIKLYSVLTCGINKCSKHLVGKVVVITGGSSGIGFETAKDLAFRGARVIIGTESEEIGSRARDDIVAATGNQDVFHRHLDLASFNSVRKFVKVLLKTEKQLDILINNAGVMDSTNATTEDGISLGMQINHFGPFLLTNLLLPLLKSSAPSRIITVTSMSYRAGNIDFQNFEKISADKFNTMRVYNATKLCNVLMTTELERKLRGTGVTANCLHPGVVNTSIIIKTVGELLWRFIRLLHFLCKTAWEGAQTSVYLAVSPDVSDVSGHYFSDCRISKLTKKAEDPVLAGKVWEASNKIVQMECLTNVLSEV